MFSPRYQTYKAWIRPSLWGLGLFFLLLGFIPTLKEIINPPFQQVHILGHLTYLNPETLKKNIKPMVCKRFFNLSLQQLKQYFLETPWISNVHIRKQWPNQLYITLQEHQPTAIWNQTALLNHQGELYDVPDIPNILKQELPYLSGSEDKRHLIWSQFQWVQAQLTNFPFRIKQFSMNTQGAWSTQINQVTIQWGVHPLEKQIIFFKALYTKELYKKWSRIKSLDFRYLKSAAVLL